MRRLILCALLLVCLVLVGCATKPSCPDGKCPCCPKKVEAAACHPHHWHWWHYHNRFRPCYDAQPSAN